MTHEEFISLIKKPELVNSAHATDLKQLIELYPYFAPARLMYAKALQQNGSVLFAANLKFSSLFSSNKRWLYYFIHPEKKISTEIYRRDRNSSTKSSGNYFDMMNVVESVGGDTKQTLKSLAERLKSAREMVVSNVVSKPKEVLSATVEEETEVVSHIEERQISEAIPEFSESNAKNLIREHKYMEAIEILRALNLNNPKKSVYFADQIRFLEKVIANSKK